MTLYMSVTILIILLMVAMTIHVLHYSGFNRRQKVWFIVTFLSVSFCAAAEFAVHCGYYDSKFAIPLTILTVLQFSAAPCLAMLFAGALGLKKQGRIAIGLLSVGLITEIVCAPFGWIFRFGETGYSRGPAFLIYETFYFVSLAYMIVALIIVGRKFQKRDLVTIIMVLAVLAAGIVPMTIDKSIHVAYLAVGMSACLCYVYYNDLVQQDTSAALLANQAKVSDMQVRIISGLANLIESRDTETGEHVARTSAYVKTLAELAREDGVYTETLNDHYIELLEMLAPMHDVGKILVSDKILRKPGHLTPEEFEEMKKHATYGGDVVRQILSGVADEEYVSFASDIATYHHERWDGAGYPKQLKGDEIPLSARIMAIADVFDALVSKRCYKEAIPVEEAFQVISDEAGSHFDAELVKVFLAHKERFAAIFDAMRDKETEGEVR